MVNLDNKKSYTIYCHFSFKRPKGKDYGIFAVAFYSDFPGKKLITYKVSKLDLWQNHQFITAVQSYENALQVIYENQGMMRAAGINQVMLVTDNSTLAGWIINPKKNKAYTPFMERAVKQYRAGAAKEIVLGIGLCEPRDAEKSYKYCKEELVSNDYRRKSNLAKDSDNNVIGYKIDLGDSYKSVLDVIKEDKAIPEINGIKTII